MRLRCRLGWHDWRSWKTVAEGAVQFRECHSCGIGQKRRIA